MRYNEGELVLVYMGKDSQYDEELWMTATYVRYRNYGHYVRLKKYSGSKTFLFKTDIDKIRKLHYDSN